MFNVYRNGPAPLQDNAAHVVSPVFGVGINYAIQDVVVACNLRGPRLLGGAEFEQ